MLVEKNMSKEQMLEGIWKILDIEMESDMKNAKENDRDVDFPYILNRLPLLKKIYEKQFQNIDIIKGLNELYVLFFEIYTMEHQQVENSGYMTVDFMMSTMIK